MFSSIKDFLQNKVLQGLIDRLTQKSTWAGLVLALAGRGLVMSGATQDQLIQLGTDLGGLVLILFNEKWLGKK